jgi:hypothetical protein
LRGEDFQGKAWNIHLDDTLSALAVLEKTPGIQRVGLAADNLRAITDQDIESKQLSQVLQDNGIEYSIIESSDPNLEDVFLSLALE